MCYGFTRTGARCTQLYYLNSHGLCRHHVHQRADIIRRDALLLEQVRRRIAIRKALRESQTRKEQAVTTPKPTDSPFWIACESTTPKMAFGCAFAHPPQEPEEQPESESESESDYGDAFLAEVDKFLNDYKQKTGGCVTEEAVVAVNPDDILDVVDKFVDDYKQMAARCVESAARHKIIMEEHKKNMMNLDIVLKKFDENAATLGARIEQTIDDIIKTSNELLA